MVRIIRPLFWTWWSGSKPTPTERLGAVGCALSHRKAWRQLAASQSDWALVTEDDVDGAIRLYRRALEVQPGRLEAMMSLANLYTEISELKAAEGKSSGPPVPLSSLSQRQTNHWFIAC